VDFYAEVRKYDLSFLWTQGIDIFTGDEVEDWAEDDSFPFIRPEPLGYIGDNYQRFYIHFLSVIQNKENPYEYYVYGKTKVKNNICDFQGTIRITDAQWLKDEYLKEYKEISLKGDYTFYEDGKQKHTGKLNGKFCSDFVIDPQGVLHYNALNLVADGYRNNQFEGKWTDYKTGASKKCNWGDYRIPDSRKNFDYGVGEFSPDEHYYPYGWENYRYLHDDSAEGEEARRKEQIEWWKF